MTVLPSLSAGEIQVVEVVPTVSPVPTGTPVPPKTRIGVYLSGAVTNPGVYMVDGGSRLANVLLLAGGATAEANLTAVNLAAVVQDEDHWHIPAQGEVTRSADGLSASARSAESAADTGPSSRGDDIIDLNSADVELLKTLPGIGDVRARAIVSYREANGKFASVDSLLDVDGIGVGTVNNIRDLVSVE